MSTSAFRSLRACVLLLLPAALACDPDASDPGSDLPPPFLEVDADTGDARHEPIDEAISTARTTTTIVHLPVASGERYTATTYAGHGDAWDFNLSSGDDGGEAVVAVEDGTVTAVETNCDSCTISNTSSTSVRAYGNYVKVCHTSGTWCSRYAHLQEVYVVTGQVVRQGQTLGTIGSTGYSTGNHLHYQLEDASTGTRYLPKFYSFDGTSRVSGYLTSGSTYTSYNAGVFEDARDRNGGTSVVGTSSPKIATRVAADGHSKSYVGGSLGDTTVYMQTLGCDGGDYCPDYNNTNNAWLVKGAIRTWYYACGGPASCWLGFPTGDEAARGSGTRQTFEFGYVDLSASGTVSASGY